MLLRQSLLQREERREEEMVTEVCFFKDYFLVVWPLNDDTPRSPVLWRWCPWLLVQTHTHTRRHTPTDVHTHTHTRRHTPTDVHTHTHTHTRRPWSVFSRCQNAAVVFRSKGEKKQWINNKRKKKNSLIQFNSRLLPSHPSTLNKKKTKKKNPNNWEKCVRAVAWHVIAMVCEQQCSVAGIKPKPAHNTHSENYTCLYRDRHAHTAADTYAYTQSHTHTHTQRQAAGGWASVWMTWPRFGEWVISTPHTHIHTHKKKKKWGNVPFWSLFKQTCIAFSPLVYICLSFSVSLMSYVRGAAVFSSLNSSHRRWTRFNLMNVKKYEP